MRKNVVRLSVVLCVIAVCLLAGCRSAPSIGGAVEKLALPNVSKGTNYLNGGNPYYTGTGEKLNITAADVQVFARNFNKMEDLFSDQNAQYYTRMEDLDAEFAKIGISGPNESGKVFAIYQGGAYIAAMDSLYDGMNPLERVAYKSLYSGLEEQYGVLIAEIHPDDMAVIEANANVLQPLYN